MQGFVIRYATSDAVQRPDLTPPPAGPLARSPPPAPLPAPPALALPPPAAAWPSPGSGWQQLPPPPPKGANSSSVRHSYVYMFHALWLRLSHLSVFPATVELMHR